MVRQVIPHAQWPSGRSRPLAVLRAAPETLTQRYGLHFTEDHDDLDVYHYAAIALEDGSQVWLLRYRHDPEPGTVVSADAAGDAAHALAMVGRTLAVTERDLSWIAPAVAAARIATPFAD